MEAIDSGLERNIENMEIDPLSVVEPLFCRVVDHLRT